MLGKVRDWWYGSCYVDGREETLGGVVCCSHDLGCWSDVWETKAVLAQIIDAADHFLRTRQGTRDETGQRIESRVDEFMADEQ